MTRTTIIVWTIEREVYMFKLFLVETIIRPNYSSVEVAIRAKSTVFETRPQDRVPNTQLDVSWLPRIAVPNNQGDDQTQDLYPFKAIGCQECLVYLSKCYCGEVA